MRRVGFAVWAPCWRWSQLTTRTPCRRDSWTISRRKKSEQLGRRPCTRKGSGFSMAKPTPRLTQVVASWMLR
eukprot:13699129-Alexandrium_andersonii.AAC.1